MLESKPLARTGLNVPTLCFGTGGLIKKTPDADGPQARDLARATARAIFDSPVRFIDTARIYGRGLAEDRIGEVLRERGGLPPDFTIATKLDLDFAGNRRFDGAAARRSLDASTRALGLDRFHILYLHDPEFVADITDVTGPHGSMVELMKMKEEGFCDAVGLGAGNVDIMAPLLRDWDYDVVLTHNRHTLINANAEPLIELALSRGMAVINAAPYGGGVFAKGSANVTSYSYLPAKPEVLAAVRQVEAICARYGVPPGAVALQFSMRDPRITSTVIGVARPERVAETVAWANLNIPVAIWDELAAIPRSPDNPQADLKLPNKST